ncbi:MAG: hypothetical protein NZ827_00835 [Aquificaceae bacterium]|nr:hypothetical protein [Aquificaceae bacterium]MCS7195801.1 hypothetical protein [Aquificaceae bacterium]
MSLKRIIRIKENLKELRLRELREIERMMASLKKKIEEVEKVQEELNRRIKSNFSEGLLLRYRALDSQRRRMLEELELLKTLHQEKKNSLREIYKDVKVLGILRERLEKEGMGKSQSLEAQKSAFLHIIRRWKGHV